MGMRAYRSIAALVAFTVVLSRVSADTNATLPANATGPFNPAKYTLPLPIDTTHALTEGVAANATSHQNMTVNSTMPTAGHFDLQQSAKYILPVANKTTGVSGTTEGARVESADATTSASIVASPTSASAQIESVPAL